MQWCCAAWCSQRSRPAGPALCVNLILWACAIASDAVMVLRCPVLSAISARRPSATCHCSSFRQAPSPAMQQRCCAARCSHRSRPAGPDPAVNIRPSGARYRRRRRRWCRAARRTLPSRYSSSFQHYCHDAVMLLCRPGLSTISASWPSICCQSSRPAQSPAMQLSRCDAERGGPRHAATPRFVASSGRGVAGDGVTQQPSQSTGAACAATRSESTFPFDKLATFTSRSAISKYTDLLDEQGRDEGTARTAEAGTQTHEQGTRTDDTGERSESRAASGSPLPRTRDPPTGATPLAVGAASGSPLPLLPGLSPQTQRATHP